MEKFIIVGLGGALGAIGRYAISLIPYKSGFPVLTLLTNLIGAIIIGFVVGISADALLSEKSTLFWKTGVCGGFTTFSTFSLESLQLFENKEYVAGSIYVLLSIGLCIAGVAFGRWISNILRSS